MAHHLRRRLDPSLLQPTHQMDATPRRVRLRPELQVGGARRLAEAAVHAREQLLHLDEPCRGRGHGRRGASHRRRRVANSPAVNAEARRQLPMLGAILLVAAVVRLLVNDVAPYSPADETYYTETTRSLVRDGWWRGYPALVDRFLADPTGSIYPQPPPIRWGYFAVTTAACHIAGSCEARTLAWVSTLAGIATVALTFLAGTALISPQVGLVAAALSVASPLQLAMGRRALQDQLFCAVVLLFLLLVLPIVSGRASRGRYAAAIATLAFAFSLKETAAVLYPPLALFLVLAMRRRGFRAEDLLLLALPPVIWAVGFGVAAHDIGDFARVVATTRHSITAPYQVQFQGGPPHRIALDLFILSPLVCLVAVVGCGVVSQLPAERGVRATVLLTLVLVLALSLAPSKNVRYAIVLDPLLRILAAWTLVVLAGARHGWVTCAVAANAACELAIFSAVFLRAAVYDPVTANLLRALRIQP